MRVLIENYRKWEIFFDTEAESFYTASDWYDRQATKASYASIKKFIDDFIKDNMEFKPVFVERYDNFRKEKVRLVGLKKDKCFMYEDEKGVRKQMSKYDERYYYLSNSDNEKQYEVIKQLEEKVTALRKQIREEEEKIIKVSLDEIRDKYLNQ